MTSERENASSTAHLTSSNDPSEIRLSRDALLLRVLLAGSSFHSRPLRNTVNPFQQMWEGLHVFLAEATECPSLDPRPGSDIRDRVFAFAVAGQVLARLTGVLAAQLDLEDAVDAEGLIAESFDGVCGSPKASTCHVS